MDRPTEAFKQAQHDANATYYCDCYHGPKAVQAIIVYAEHLESEVERLQEEVRFMHAARQWDGTPGEAAKKLERVKEWTEQDIRRAAWEDDEDVITINGKPVGPTFGRSEARHRVAALQCARREVLAILNEEQGGA